MSQTYESIQVVITYDPHRTDASAIRQLAKGDVKVFKSFPVLAFHCDEQDIEAMRALDGVVYVHMPRFWFYTKFLEYFDQLCLLPEEMGARCLVVNLSASPGPYPFSEAEPMNLATRSAAEKGFAIVVAAGNEGPGENTLNPWSVAPWVIGVGAADRWGKELWVNSSVGRPGDQLYHPTVVAPGKDVPVLIAPSSHRERLHGTTVTSVVLSAVKGAGEDLQSGTSLATPLVARVCWYVIKFIDALYITDRLLKKISESGTIDSSDAMWLSGIEPLPRLLSELKAHAVGYTLTFSPFVVRQIIEKMARPMKGYAVYQVGAGFVDDDVAESYLTQFGVRDFLQFFGDGKVDSTFANKLDKPFGPLIPSGIITDIVEQVRKQSRVVDCSIYEQALPTDKS